MMKLRHVTDADGRVHFPDHPNARLLALEERDETAALGAFALHEFDLEYCARALTECRAFVGRRTDESRLRVKMFWTAAVALYVKCFRADGSRRGLKPDIFSTDALREKHAYYLELRNKHLIHDVNPFAQVLVGAVVSADAAGTTVHDVVTIVYEIEPDANDVESVLALVTEAHAFVLQQSTILSAGMRLELTQRAHAELKSLKEQVFVEPPDTAVKRSRGRP